MIPTNEQKAIFEFVRSSNHHGIIDAVAGSGKTTTIMESTKHVPNGLDLMFCAFNKSISKEIKRKFKQINQGNIKVKTIHALGFDILKSNSERDYQFDDNKYLKLLKEMLDQDAFSFELASILELNDIPVEPVDRMEEKQHRDFFYHFRDKLLDINTDFHGKQSPVFLTTSRMLLQK
ncbi:MAG: AAA family ATPase [Bacteroidales bacterium]|nr:AAA family ATPase [Bacteroidales bacterium]